jgi:hypothetical protein
MLPPPFQPSGPQSTTCTSFTANILFVSISPSAFAEWVSPVRKQQNLYRALFDHEAMAPNRQQTFMTPAAQKSSVYHLWDFVGRTLQFFLYSGLQEGVAEEEGEG